MKIKNSFLEGPILPSLLRFSLPVLFALMLQALYGAVDLWAVGKFAETADISAVATGSQTMQIIIGIITELSMGTTVLLGQKIGCQDQEGAAQTIGTSIIIFTALGILLSILVVVSARPCCKDHEYTRGSVSSDGSLYSDLRRRKSVHSCLQSAECDFPGNGRFQITPSFRLHCFCGKYHRRYHSHSWLSHGGFRGSNCDRRSTGNQRDSLSCADPKQRITLSFYKITFNFSAKYSFRCDKTRITHCPAGYVQ